MKKTINNVWLKHDIITQYYEPSTTRESVASTHHYILTGTLDLQGKVVRLVKLHFLVY